MKVLSIWLPEHSCEPTLTSRHAKIVSDHESTGRIEVRCGWPKCNALVAYINVVYPDDKEPA